MEFVPAVKSAFSKYATFSGRASRSEYWYFYLFSFLLGIITQIIDVSVLHVDPNDPHAFYPINTIFSLAILLPSLAIAARRLHDTERSGWWLLIGFTVIGIIFPLLYWFCKKGTEGDNRYGADPLAGASS